MRECEEVLYSTEEEAHFLGAKVVVVPIGQRVDEAFREVHRAHLVYWSRDGRRDDRLHVDVRQRRRVQRRLGTGLELALRTRVGSCCGTRGGGGRLRVCRLVLRRYQAERESRLGFGRRRIRIAIRIRRFGGGGESARGLLRSGRAVRRGGLLLAASQTALRKALEQRVDARHGAAHEVSERSRLTRERRERRESLGKSRRGRTFGGLNVHQLVRRLSHLCSCTAVASVRERGRGLRCGGCWQRRRRLTASAWRSAVAANGAARQLFGREDGIRAQTGALGALAEGRRVVSGAIARLRTIASHIS